jgi:hypothetical protein
LLYQLSYTGIGKGAHYQARLRPMPSERTEA